MRSSDGVAVRHPGLEAADRLPVARLPPGVLQQPHRMVTARLHALRRRARSRCGGGTSSRSFGGWSRDYTCEDIELTFRVHEVLRQQGRPYRVVCLPDRVGVTEGPGHGAQARRPAGALAARDPRDVVGIPAACASTGATARSDCSACPSTSLSEIVAPFFELRRDRHARRRAVAGLVDWWQFAVRHARDHARQQRASTTGRAADASTSKRGSTTSVRVVRLLRADAARARRLPPDHGVGAAQGHVAVPPR